MSHADTPPYAYEHHGRRVAREAFYEIACDPRRSVAVEACAGAGKTWMLVSRMVRALLDGAQPHEILAITFTKKAAGEMRERLNKWLEEFSRLDDEALRAQLAQRGLRVDAGSPLLARLRGLYRELLSTGRPVQIRTFHSWFAALLRTAPLATLEALGLPARHELLENDSEAVALVWRRFFASVSTEPALRADYEACVAEFGRTQTEKSLHAALSKRVEFALADAQGVVDASVQAWAQVFPDLAGVGDPMDHLLIEGPIRALMWEAAGLLGRASQASFAKSGVALESALTAGDVKGVTAALMTNDGPQRKFSEKVAGIERVREAQAHLLHLQDASAQHKAWQHQGRMARLTRLLIDEFGALKRDEGWVDMNDVERAALVLLSDPVLSGWVQERLDARTAHLLIDEFQDTNPLQWQALHAWLAGYAGAGGRVPAVFLVGDPKQSIYRFRRAEPQVFRAAQRFIVEGLGGDQLSCDHTHRNAHRVLAAMNAAIGAAQAQGDYEGFRAHTTESNEAGAVLALPAIARPPRAPRKGASDDAGEDDDGDTSEDGEAPWRDSLVTPRELPQERLMALECRQAARWIAARLAQGLHPSDVMVLARKRDRLSVMEDELRTLGVPAQQPEKTRLGEAAEVQDLVALLDVLVSPSHDLSLARVLKSPLFGVPDEGLVELALLAREAQAAGAPRSWLELLQQAPLTLPALQGVGERLAQWKRWVDRLPPHDALDAIYHDGDVLARFAQTAQPALRESVLANLRALLGAALQVGGGRYATPYAFVRALRAGGVDAPAVAQPEAVRLLTIHGAKGLEAPLVLMLDTDAGPPKAETMGVIIDWPGEASAPRRFAFIASESHPPACCRDAIAAEQLARRREELNALYVAMTRARQTLVVSCVEPYQAAPASWWQRLHSLCEAAAVPVPQDHPAPADAGTACLWTVPAPALPPATLQSEARAEAQADTPQARFGRALHRLLEHWPAGQAEPASALLQRVAREFALDDAALSAAAAMALRIRQGEGAWAWDPQAIAWAGNEVDLFHGGQLLRLDRLVRARQGDCWWVLDYKSAARPEADATLLEQLRAYRAAVSAVYPGQDVRAAFLTGEGRLVPLE
jgi:ATP-dependent helicase/nuclease subunit A